VGEGERGREGQRERERGSLSPTGKMPVPQRVNFIVERALRPILENDTK
jgi:hypothetical protein